MNQAHTDNTVRTIGLRMKAWLRGTRQPYNSRVVVQSVDMEPDVAELFAAALAAQANAHAPYSRYRVGAAVRTASGHIYAGANVENAAYPQGWCAEASALAAMVTAGDRHVTAILTIADGELLGTCCGGCRQKLREFSALDTPVYACGPDGVRATFTLAELLPYSFGPEHLDA
jgi:cytidine deaminase